MKGRCVLVTFCWLTLCALGQSNIVYNGSFEETPMTAGWNVERMMGGDFHIGDWHAAEGKNWLEVDGAIFQDLPTVPGRNYIVRVGSGYHSSMQVRWGESATQVLYFTNSGLSLLSWSTTNAVFAATTTPTRLQFESSSGPFKLDAVEVGWLEEPPTITIPVASRSTFEGGCASFAVTACGGPPLQYQWFKNNAALPGATNRVILFTNVTKADAAEYWVRVTNSFGAISSLRAQLLVHPLPQIPLIVAQPKSQSVRAGYSAGLSVVAFGTEPLRYQWRFRGADLPDATNATYFLATVDPTNSGDYTVLLSNRFGTAWSIPATLQVLPGAPGGGYVWLCNRAFPTLESPVFDVDGVTPLAGSNFVAQLYAGATPEALHSVDDVVYFRTGRAAGIFASASRVVPDVPPGQTAYIQVRAWDLTQGRTFEEAQARGARFGKSNLMPITVVDDFTPPNPLELRSFNLEAGMSLLATARIERGASLPGGQQEWLLIGDGGYRYVVEHRTPPNDWTPVTTLTNITGLVRFIDPDPQNSSVKFYRARILEP